MHIMVFRLLLVEAEYVLGLTFYIITPFLEILLLLNHQTITISLVEDSFFGQNRIAL